MNYEIYQFRAECALDALVFLADVYRRGINTKEIKITQCEGFPDVLCTVKVNAELTRLRNIALQISDAHVIERSLQSLSN